MIQSRPCTGKQAGLQKGICLFVAVSSGDLRYGEHLHKNFYGFSFRTGITPDMKTLPGLVATARWGPGGLIMVGAARSFRIRRTVDGDRT
jgi:hypothetical protein